MTDHPAWFNDAADAMGDRLVFHAAYEPPDAEELLAAAMPHIRAGIANEIRQHLLTTIYGEWHQGFNGGMRNAADIAAGDPVDDVSTIPPCGTDTP